MTMKLIKLFGVVKVKINYLFGKNKPDSEGTTDNPPRKTNPYQLIWYRQGWSQRKVSRNNTKYWEFEVKHNGLKL